MSVTRAKSCSRESETPDNNAYWTRGLRWWVAAHLGTFQAGALARAGVGFLRIVDRDYVELSNLQRQWLFDQCDVEQALPKSVAAARKLAAINSDIRIEPVVADLVPENADELLGDSRPDSGWHG